MTDPTALPLSVARRKYGVPLPGGRFLELGSRTLLMGVVNVTPDSFSDGGRYLDPQRAIAQARELVAAGADIVDIGGESTRPGSEAVPPDEELARVLPVIEGLVGSLGVPISVDTNKAVVAQAAVEAGAAIINDIRGLADPDMAAVAARTGAALVVMHCPVAPRVMAAHTNYGDLLGEVIAYLGAARDRAVAAGVPRQAVIVDPGLGFAKTPAQSARLLMATPALVAALDCPVLVGPSRKSLIGRVLGKPPDQRLMGTAAAVALGIAAGGHIMRVHDVSQLVDVSRMADYLMDPVELPPMG